jgi:hypothetical protein
MPREKVKDRDQVADGNGKVRSICAVLSKYEKILTKALTFG